MIYNGISKASDVSYNPKNTYLDTKNTQDAISKVANDFNKVATDFSEVQSRVNHVYSWDTGDIPIYSHLHPNNFMRVVARRWGDLVVVQILSNLLMDTGHIEGIGGIVVPEGFRPVDDCTQCSPAVVVDQIQGDNAWRLHTDGHFSFITTQQGFTERGATLTFLTVSAYPSSEFAIKRGEDA